MKKQTAVEWLEEQLRKRYGSPSLYRLVNQAKEMEEEQSLEDYSVGYSNGQVDSNRTAKQYYNETYKNTEE